MADVFDGNGRIQLLRVTLTLLTAIALNTEQVKKTMDLYLNALEPLVVQEVERQLQNLPPALVAYINPAQAIAYALNRLPPLYATSEEGWNRQQQKAKTQLAQQIESAVKSGLNAVLQNPLKPSTPLQLPPQTAEKYDRQILVNFPQYASVQLWP
ncbi:late competence development ComFB family protein [Microseira wollei]|uniref:late competence development ComFB family protein n=1 Tax=Microseira wollei TaxID=467598 RepID=UPI001CFEEC2E|nr:late competence development ComFB family protein [Microseira wollei]